MNSARLLIFSQDDANMKYATHFSLPDPCIWIQIGTQKQRKEYLIVSRLEYSRAKQLRNPRLTVILQDTIRSKTIHGRTKNLADTAASFLHNHRIKHVIIPENTWSLHLETLREHNINTTITTTFFPERLIKTPQEIRAIQHTGKTVKKAFNRCLTIIKAATINKEKYLIYQHQRLTAEDMKKVINNAYLEHDCDGKDTIVSCGTQTAQPHNTGTGYLRAGVPIVFDLFPRDNTTGYYFDMTRTIIKGTPTPKVRKLYQTVATAQRACLARVKAGNKVSDIHNAATSIFNHHHYQTTNEEGFIHAAGHGLGLEIHEPPRLHAQNKDTLRAGMVLAIEPGLYYKKLGGVRIEDTIIVTATGHTNITNIPKIIIIP